MPLILSGNVASATAGVYEVANSCRFNDGDSPRLHRTLGTATDVDKWTFSCWFKRSTLSATQYLFYGYASGEESAIVLKSDDTIDWYNYFSSSEQGQLVTNRKFRDVGAWYHLVCAYDSDNGTAGNRMRMYINGTEETSFATDTNPASDENSTINKNVLHNIGMKYSDDGSGYFDGYLAEVCFVDGQQLTPSSFGEFDDDTPTVFKSIDVSGLTFGDNGAYLDFEDSDNLGDDESGNTNDWTEVNLAATDQCTDSPTNNWCVISPLTTTNSRWTISEGNCKLANNSSGWSPATATIGVTSGKWYCEVKCTAVGDGSVYGIMDFAQYDDGTLEMSVYSRAWIYRAATGYYHNNDAYGAGTSYGDSFTTNDIIGIYLDLDNNKVYWAKNGTLQNSGTGISITDGYDYTFAFNMYNVGGDATTYNVCEVNFGNPTWSLSSAVADANGYGSFEYNPSSGTFDSASKDFYALCTKNLAEFGG